MSTEASEINKTESEIPPTPNRSFWESLKESKEFSLYYPNRFEYFVGRSLQGLLTGRAEKDVRKVVKRSIALAIEMEEALDSAQD